MYQCFIFKSLGRDQFLCFLWRSCYLADFFFMNNVPLKGKVYIFTSCCINNYIITFLTIPQNTVFFQVWYWWGPGYFIVSELILLASVSMLVLLDSVFVGVSTLIWSIMVLECISKIIVDNGFNHWMGWCHVYICCL